VAFRIPTADFRRDGRARVPDQQPQPPPQQPPQDGAAGPAAPVTATVESSLTVSSCPCGQAAGFPASAIGREISNVSPQRRQRYS
jgi:hypothetical protein